MTIQQVSERELEVFGVRCVAVPSLEWGSLKYVWLTSYTDDMQAAAQKRCQDLCASGRAALLIRHNAGNLTVWQGPAGSAQPLALEPQGLIPEEPQQLPIAPPAVPQAPEPQPVAPQPQTVTIKYRGRTIIKQVGPTDDNPKQKGQRSYRGQKY